MPIYEYACSQCGKLNEVIQKISDPTPAQCEGCKAGGTLSKVVSRSSFVLKGGGWYSDLYSSTKKESAPSSGASSSASSSSATPAKSESSSSTSTTSTASTSTSSPVAAKPAS